MDMCKKFREKDKDMLDIGIEYWSDISQKTKKGLHRTSSKISELNVLTKAVHSSPALLSYTYPIGG